MDRLELSPYDVELAEIVVRQPDGTSLGTTPGGRTEADFRIRPETRRIGTSRRRHDAPIAAPLGVCGSPQLECRCETASAILGSYSRPTVDQRVLVAFRDIESGVADVHLVTARQKERIRDDL